MSCLTDLVKLSLWSSKVVDLVELQWIRQLTSLEHLHIGHVSCTSDSLTAVLSLTQLTRLSLQGARYFETPFPPLHTNCQWHQLRLLRELRLANFVVKLGQSSAASLLQLVCLTHLSFYNVSEGNDRPLATFASLFHSFATKRPNVEVVVDGHPILHSLQHAIL